MRKVLKNEVEKHGQITHMPQRNIAENRGVKEFIIVRDKKT